MKNNSYMSSKYYTYNFKNFSTMIITPMTILLMLILIIPFFAIRQNSVKGKGILGPEEIYNIKNNNYQEGEIVKRENQDWIVHIDEKRKSIVHLIPLIKTGKNIEIVVYLPPNKISAVKKGQQLSLQLENADGKFNRLTGKVKTIAIYPTNFGNLNLYQVIATTKVKRDDLKYGMQGEVSIITGKSTYFDYFKNKILDKKLNQS